MKNTLYFLLLAIAFQSCSTKKAETAETPVDTVTVDNTLATTPAPSALAFSASDPFSLDKSHVLEDSVNYAIFFNAEQLTSKLGPAATLSGMPDFVINYVIAIACPETKQSTTITIDKVETGDSSIDVYVTIQRGEQQKLATRPARVFSIERRDGFPVMQFYVNGKKDQGLVLVEAQ